MYPTCVINHIVHARCRQPTGGELRGRQGRDCAAFKRLVLSSATASSARKGADCSAAAKGASRCSLLRKPAVVRCSARRTGTSLAQAASQRQPHVTCHKSRITREPSPVMSKTAFVCVAACAWWRVALKHVSAAAHHNYHTTPPRGGDGDCSTYYLFSMRFRYRISHVRNHDIPLKEGYMARYRAEQAQRPSLNTRA
jgi:hypothetical protein